MVRLEAKKLLNSIVKVTIRSINSRLAANRPLSSLRNLYKNDFSRHFDEFKTCSMSFGSLTKINSAGPSQNLIKLLCWYFSSVCRMMSNRSEKTYDWETPSTKDDSLSLQNKTFNLTVLIFLDELVRTSNYRVSSRAGNFISKLVQCLVPKNIFHRANNYNDRAYQQKHDSLASSSQHRLSS